MLTHLFTSTKTNTRAHLIGRNIMLLLHGAAELSTAFDKRWIFSVKQLSTKTGKWEKVFLSLDYFGGQ